MLAVIGVVAYTLRPRQSATPPPPVEKLEPKETIRTRGGDAQQLKGAEQDLRVSFKEQVTYDDGTTKLIGAKIAVDHRGGRNFVVMADEARIGKDRSTFDVKGHVRLEASDGFVANSESASYVDAEKLVRAPGPVTFSQGRMSGSGVGFTYDNQRNTLWLLDQAVIAFARTETAAPMNVNAGAAGFARTDRYMRFERTVHLEREGQVIDSTEAMVYLLMDRDEPDRIELRGNARIAGGQGLGSLESMSARDLNLDYRDDGRTLQQAVLAGQAAIKLAPKNGVAGQTLAGEYMDMTLNEDGTLSQLVSRDNVSVTLPPAKDTPARTIRSVALAAKGEPGQGLTSMTFQDGVEYRETAAKDHAARVARARTLEATLDGGTGALKEAVFAGGFRFDEEATRATSDTATYQIDAGRLVLASAKGATPPQIADETLTVDADSLDVTLEPRRMTAKGNVKTQLQPTAKQKDQKDTAQRDAAKRPGLLGDNDIVNVMADALQYDEQSRKGTYTGKARLFQGDTSVTASQIVLDESKGDLSATTDVVTNLVIVDSTAPKDVKPTTTLARAGAFTYSDQTRQAVYETLVTLDGPQGNLRAGKMTLSLDKEENTLLRLEAVGLVTAMVDKRTTTGTSLNYFAADERYLFQGATVKMIDADCQETTGKTLTFFKSSARVIVDGNEEVRTQTKGGGKCPATPPQ
jgi:lipopolysaccharide export system protein LptA